MDNEAIARRLEGLAIILEIRGDDPFRLRSYRNAAETIREWPVSLKEIAAKEGAKGLQAIPGIGKAISAKIIELCERGTFESWERITAETPETVLDLLEVDGIGMKTAAALHGRFRISSLDDLAKFVAGGGLEMVDGIADKTAEKIKKSIKERVQTER